MRARFKALGGIPYPSRPAKPKRNTPALQPHPQRKRSGPFYGVSLSEVRPAWVGKANDLPESPLGKRQRTGKPAVVRLAESVPAKLKLDKTSLQRYRL